jgi:hypothetical protein
LVILLAVKTGIDVFLKQLHPLNLKNVEQSSCVQSGRGVEIAELAKRCALM